MLGLSRDAMAPEVSAYVKREFEQGIKSIGPDVLRHRIIPSYEAEAEGVTSDDLVRRIFDGVEVP